MHIVDVLEGEGYRIAGPFSRASEAMGALSPDLWNLWLARAFNASAREPRNSRRGCGAPLVSTA
jgi:hypothetical protein